MYAIKMTFPRRGDLPEERWPSQGELFSPRKDVQVINLKKLIETTERYLATVKMETLIEGAKQPASQPGINFNWSNLSNVLI